MTHMQHMRTVTHKQHTKSASHAVSPLACSTRILLACSVRNTACVWPVACYTHITRVTRQKLKSACMFSAHECQLRNELYRMRLTCTYNNHVCLITRVHGMIVLRTYMYVHRADSYYICDPILQNPEQSRKPIFSV